MAPKAVEKRHAPETDSDSDGDADQRKDVEGQLDAMMASGEMKLRVSDGSLTVHRDILRLASPTVLAGAIDALHAPRPGANGNVSTSKELPKLQVGGKKATWKLVLMHLYPVLAREAPSLQQLHDMLPIAHKWDMRGLMDYIGKELAARVSGSMENEASSHKSVFKWLLLSEELQLDRLKQECIDALGTYLLPGFSAHLAGNRQRMSQLTPATLVQVIQATSRCEQCLSRAASQRRGLSSPSREGYHHGYGPGRGCGCVKKAARATFSKGEQRGQCATCSFRAGGKRPKVK